MDRKLLGPNSRFIWISFASDYMCLVLDNPSRVCNHVSRVKVRLTSQRKLPPHIEHWFYTWSHKPRTSLMISDIKFYARNKSWACLQIGWGETLQEVVVKPARLASYLLDVWDCSRSRESWTWLKRRQHKVNLIVKRPLRIYNFHCISLASPHIWLPCWVSGGGEFNLWFPIKFISCANAGLSPNIHNQIVILCNCLVASTVMQWARGKNASNANEKFQL